MLRLFGLFVLLPAVELALLIEIGTRIGTIATLALIVLTGALGAFLARHQGLSVLQRMREETASGRIPAAPLVDGVIILVSAALLITPGFLTDAFGFFCLIPQCRQLLKAYVQKRLQKVIRQGDLRVSVDFRRGAGPFSPGFMRDVTPKSDQSGSTTDSAKLED